MRVKTAPLKFAGAKDLVYAIKESTKKPLNNMRLPVPFIFYKTLLAAKVGHGRGI